MKAKITSLFLALLLTLLSLNQAIAKKGTSSILVKTYSHSLDRVHFSAKQPSEVKNIITKQKRANLIPLIKKLPSHHTSALKNILFDYRPHASRGLGGKDLIIMRNVNISDDEFFAVLIHEIGHSVDLGVLNSSAGKISEFKDLNEPIYEKDPSLSFYRLSWENESMRKKGLSNEDFVSGYAMTDPFEDFAETYAYYILHNKSFKTRAKKSETLNRKFRYMKSLFNGKEFNTGISKETHQIPWDITKLDYKIERFMESS